MQPHGNPGINYTVNLKKELKALDSHKIKRAVPAKSAKTLLIATWNLTNFGLQKREPGHLEMMSRIISYFDIVAVQEIADDLTHFAEILGHLGKSWDAIYSDTSGNNERLGYFYNTKKAEPVGLVAELAIAGYRKEKMVIQLADKTKEVEFTDFNRNPYMVNFQSGNFNFTTVNVHLFWSNMALREAETDVLGKWAKSRVKGKFPPNDDIILIGDFNLPSLKDDKDKIHMHLKKYGLKAAKHGTNVFGTDLAGEFDYDEVVFFPGQSLDNFTGNIGAFDYDKAVFQDLWDENDKKKQKVFFEYIRYFMTDHRPLWTEFKIG